MPVIIFLRRLSLTLALGLLLGAVPAFAKPICSATAGVAYKACRSEVADDFWIAIGNCLNAEIGEDLRECQADARDDRHEALEECGVHLGARLDLCDELGEERYDPSFDPADFETTFSNQNAYFPLTPGNLWIYEEGDETITVEVRDETKLIEGVTCIVVNDLVEDDSGPVEDTDDWYGQATNGDLYYCGEISENYELFPGDDPEEPELVDVEGSWKTGRDGALPGIQMFASPVVGTVYRQEMALGNAEDAAEVLSTTYGLGNDPELDEHVPADLVLLLCDDDCVVTREFTPVDPEANERKYYAPGIGFFLAVDVNTGDTGQLVACNVAPECALLPAP